MNVYCSSQILLTPAKTYVNVSPLAGATEHCVPKQADIRSVSSRINSPIWTGVSVAYNSCAISIITDMYVIYGQYIPTVQYVDLISTNCTNAITPFNIFFSLSHCCLHHCGTLYFVTNQSTTLNINMIFKYIRQYLWTAVIHLPYCNCLLSLFYSYSSVFCFSIYSF